MFVRSYDLVLIKNSRVFTSTATCVRSKEGFVCGLPSHLLGLCILFSHWTELCTGRGLWNLTSLGVGPAIYGHGPPGSCGESHLGLDHSLWSDSQGHSPQGKQQRPPKQKPFSPYKIFSAFYRPCLLSSTQEMSGEWARRKKYETGMTSFMKLNPFAV